MTHWCNRSYLILKLCPDGYYSGSASASCSQCPAGQECFDGSSYLSTPVDCSAGTYSPLGTSTCLNCATGMHQVNKKITKINENDIQKKCILYLMSKMYRWDFNIIIHDLSRSAWYSFWKSSQLNIFIIFYSIDIL